MTEITSSENAKEKFEDYNNILKLKDSITSDLIKKMLEEEELKVKEDHNDKIDFKINNKKPNKKKNNNNNDKNCLYFPLKKIQPKSKTLKNLMKEKQNKNMIKSIKKKVINEDKNKIIDNKKKDKNFFKNLDNINEKSTTEVKIGKTKNTTHENSIKIYDINNIDRKIFSPQNKKQKKIFINDEIKENDIKGIYNSEEKSERKKPKFLIYNNLLIKEEDKSKNNKEKLTQKKNSIYNEINQNLQRIYNNNEIRKEKTIKDFDIFLIENDDFEANYSPEIQKTLNIFKKGNKFIKKNIYLSKFQNYSPQEILKNLIFKDILSFLTPIEQYIYSKTNKESLIKYMKSKGIEAESLLDNYKNQKLQIEKILNKNQNIKVTKENFFNDHRLTQIFNLLNDDKYLEIFIDKTKVPDDNIVFVFKLFFLIIKGTDKLVDLSNDIFWEKISTYFINHTNEFNNNDYLLGELVKKMLEQKLDFSEAKIQKIKGIVDQIDLRQINPNTFKDESPTTSQFCFILGYFLEFFGVIGKEWNPLEIEYKELIQKMNELIKKINKIGLYIVNLKYKNQFK